MSLRDKYLTTTRATNTTEVPGWGTVVIRTLTVAEAERIAKGGEADSIALTVLLGVGDQDGGRVFPDTDLEAVKQLPFAVVRTVAEAVGKLNRLGADDVADAKKG